MPETYQPQPDMTKASKAIRQYRPYLIYNLLAKYFLVFTSRPSTYLSEIGRPVVVIDFLRNLLIPGQRM